MRILKINGSIADIDEKTAIGIDMQAYDFKEPGNLKVNVSNTFSIPATAHNRLLLGNAGSPSRVSDTIYQKINVDYQVRNTLYIKEGAARITSIKEGRINLFVAERVAVIDSMKAVKFIDFATSYFNSQTNPIFADFQGLVNFYKTKDFGISLKAIHSVSSDVMLESFGHNLSIWKSLVGIGSLENIEGGVTSYENSFGGHYVIYVKSLFDYIEDYFEAPLFIRTGDTYTIFQDIIFNKLYISFQNIQCSLSVLQLEFLQPIETIDLSYKDLTLFDFFDTTLKLLGYGIEPINDKIEFVRLDLMNQINSGGDLLPGYPVNDYKMSNEYIPSIEGYGIVSYIKMKVAAGLNELTGAKIIESDNQNSQVTKDLFTLNAFVPDFWKMILSQPLYVQDDIVFTPIVREYKSFCFFIDQNPQEYIRRVFRQGIVTGAEDQFRLDESASNMAEVNLTLPEVYSVSSEYAFLDGVVINPESYKVKRWVTSSQLEGFRKIAPYYVPELGRWVFVNKIKGFNPEKSKEPVEFELIKLPWVRMPNLPEKPIEITDRWILESGFWDDNGIWKDSEFWIDSI